MGVIDIVLALLQCWFIVVSLTIENVYCHEPLARGDDRFLIQTTIDFCEENNRLFLLRPRWLVMATCMSCYGFVVGYALILVTALGNLWSNRLISALLLMFAGFKIYALAFYHLMEFTSDIPPQNPVPYWSSEIPYVFSVLTIVYKCISAPSTPPSPSTKKVQ